MKTWFNKLSTAQKLWIIGSTVAVVVLGTISGDTGINLLIGGIGMFYVAVYSTGTTRWAFLLGVAYVSLYTVICLQNRIMLDALQNIVLIPIYIYSFIYWGKNKVQPRNMSKRNTVYTLCLAVLTFVLLWGVSRLLHGNYSTLDALNTTCTLFAMVLGVYGMSISWWMWTINNLASAITFGLCLATETGSVAVFAMKVIFLVNGLIGYITWKRGGKRND